MKIGIAINNLLVREGICSLLKKDPEISIAYICENEADLIKFQKSKPDDLLIIDFYSFGFSKELVCRLFELRSDRPIMALTAYSVAEDVELLRNSGLKGYLLHDCSEDEIFDAIKFLNIGEQFYCGKVIDAVLDNAVKPVAAHEPTASCEGLNLSSREVEIINCIAEGLSTKLIADKLCISPLTVKTHRKNIMTKLGVNNTAGVVRFAMVENSAK
jgi:DNA-binding NarL/FixJ family response regulator